MSRSIPSQPIPTSSFIGRDAPKPGYSGAGAPGSLNTSLSPAERDRLREEEWRAKQGKDAGEVKVVHNKLLGGWYVVRGPAQTPLSGRFSSKEEAEAWIARHK